MSVLNPRLLSGNLFTNHICLTQGKNMNILLYFNYSNSYNFSLSKHYSTKGDQCKDKRKEIMLMTI